MYVIDFHTHVYPDSIAGRAAQSVRDFYSDGNTQMDGKVETLLDLGLRAGTDKFVILPVAMKPERTRSINNFILEQLRLHPEFYGFGTVHAGMTHLEDEVSYILENGLKGIKLHPDSQVFPIDDPRLFPMYDSLRGRCPVLLHMGDPRYDYSHPIRLRKVLDLFPGLQVIAAHFGGYEMYDTAYELLKDTDCYFDVSSSLMYMPEGLPERFINLYGAERFVYGSDFPMWNPIEEMERFLKLKLTPEQFEQIAHKTATHLLKL